MLKETSNPLIIIETTIGNRFGFFENKINKKEINTFVCGNCSNIKNNIDRLFYTCCKNKKSFVFSLNNFEIYDNSEGNPNFNIKYDYKRECLYGNEFLYKLKINNMNNLCDLRYKADCKVCNKLNLFNTNGEFNIKEIEIYDIII